MPPLRVALDARLASRTNTGDTSYWRGLIRALPDAAPDLDLLLLSNAPKPSWIPESACWRMVSAKNDRWASLVALPLAARRLGAQAFHTQYFLSPLARNGLTTIHDVSFYIGPAWFQARDRLLMQRTIPGSCQRAKAIIAVSETCKAEIERYVLGSRGKVHAVLNGLGDNIVPMTDEEALARVQGLGVPQPYVFTVGTRWPRKNTQLAIVAASQAGVPLVATGKAGWGELPESGNTRFTGYVGDEDLTALYRCASLYLAASLHEGFGIPVVEAFACGCPVLSGPGGALPEVVGDAGLVLPTYEPSEWARAILRLLGDSGTLEQMRRRGLERARRFTWGAAARATAAIYRDAAR